MEGIPMGMSDMGSILVNNKTGKVFLQNHSRVGYNEPVFYKKLVNSLAEFFGI